jgi:polyhydroxybutyrate depolymerase
MRGLTPERGSKDVDFVWKLVDTLVAQHAVDPKRVYLAGHSNGAMMTLTLACAHADRIAGIALVAGQLAVGSTCAPARPVPTLAFFGTDDPLVPFAGGGVGAFGKRGDVLSADATIAVFAKAAGCTGTRRGAGVDDAGTGTRAVHEVRSGCSARVERWVIEKGGHGWPGRGPIWKGNTKAVDATAEIAAFFFAPAAAPASAPPASAPPASAPPASPPPAPAPPAPAPAVSTP